VAGLDAASVVVAEGVDSLIVAKACEAVSDRKKPRCWKSWISFGESFALP